MAEARPLFSIVIPCYNYGHLLERAVDSVMAQGGEDWELLVVDDGSTDNTAQALEELHRKFPSPRFRSLRQNNGGPSAARNTGIANTGGEFLIFLDADDQLEFDGLEIFRKALADYPGADMVVAGHCAVNRDGTVRKHKGSIVPRDPLDRLAAYLLHKKLALSNGATLMRRKIFDHYRYPEQFRAAEDIPLFAYALANFEVVSVPEVVLRVNKHEDSLRHDLDHAAAVGMELVEEIFDTGRLPPPLQRIKKSYKARRALSLFRTFYRAGEFSRARRYYRIALTTAPLMALRWHHAKRALRAVVGDS
jgi:glycosyltransferase involved in cell wall biosynthesis